MSPGLHITPDTFKPVSSIFWDSFRNTLGFIHFGLKRTQKTCMQNKPEVFIHKTNTINDSEQN